MRLRTTAAATALATTGLILCLGGTATAADLNCSDFRTQGEAQAVLDADRSDPNGLDRDGDGIACESLPTGGTEDGTTLAVSAQVSTRPEGAVAAGDGSSTEGPGALPYVVGGMALLGAAGAAAAARRSARATA